MFRNLGYSRGSLTVACAVCAILMAGPAWAQTATHHDPSVKESPQTATAPHTVEIRNFSFGPKDMTVAQGTEVVWTNRDEEPHTVTSSDDPKAFKSPPLDANDSFSFVFTTPGIYKYYCSVHPHMTGTIIVN